MVLLNMEKLDKINVFRERINLGHANLYVKELQGR